MRDCCFWLAQHDAQRYRTQRNAARVKSGRQITGVGILKSVATLRKIYDAYSFKFLPFMGKLIAKDAESYQYLAESIRMHPDQETLKQMMTDAGLSNVDYYNLSAGVVALHKGYKL